MRKNNFLMGFSITFIIAAIVVILKFSNELRGESWEPFFWLGIPCCLAGLLGGSIAYLIGRFINNEGNK